MSLFNDKLPSRTTSNADSDIDSNSRSSASDSAASNQKDSTVITTVTCSSSSSSIVNNNCTDENEDEDDWLPDIDPPSAADTEYFVRLYGTQMQEPEVIDSV